MYTKLLVEQQFVFPYKGYVVKATITTHPELEEIQYQFRVGRPIKSTDIEGGVNFIKNFGDMEAALNYINDVSGKEEYSSTGIVPHQGKNTQVNYRFIDDDHIEYKVDGETFVTLWKSLVTVEGSNDAT